MKEMVNCVLVVMSVFVYQYPGVSVYMYWSVNLAFPGYTHSFFYIFYALMLSKSNDKGCHFIMQFYATFSYLADAFAMVIRSDCIL